jgi:hypothetical protein
LWTFLAWQRGIGNGLQLDKLLPSSREILQIPPELDMIVPTNVPEGKFEIQSLVHSNNCVFLTKLF